MLRSRAATEIVRRGLLQKLQGSPRLPSTFHLSSSFEYHRLFSSSQTSQQGDEPSPVFYEAPMGGLISRLKIVSITSCALSLVGLPLLIFLKNGDLPTTKQLGVGGIALFGATGSTLSLHFVFGPYALSMEEVATPEDTTDDTKNTAFLKATTRSVFGWKNEHVFDSLSAVEPYSGTRPFANFMVNGETLLYAHPELLDEAMRRRLIYPHGLPEEIEAAEIERNEGLPNKRKEEDDDFF